MSTSMCCNTKIVIGGVDIQTGEHILLKLTHNLKGCYEDTGLSGAHTRNINTNLVTA